MEDKLDSLQTTLSTCRKDISIKIAVPVLIAILAVAMYLQVYAVDNYESDLDDTMLVENALLLTEGYHPFFVTGYAMTGIWVWSAAIHGNWVITNWRDILSYLRAKQLSNLLWSFERARWDVYLRPVELHNRLRWVNAIVTVLIVFVVYLVSVRLSGWRSAGLAAAAICSVSPLIVDYGTSFHPEQYMTLTTALCIYFCLGEAHRKGESQWIAASVFAGLAIGAKFVMGTLWVPLMLSIYLGGFDRTTKAVIRRMVVATAVMLASYLVIDPYGIIDFTYLIKSMRSVFNFYYSEAAANVSQSIPLFEKGKMIVHGLFYCVGWGSFALAIIGMIWGIRNRKEGAWILLSGLFSYCLIMFSSSSTFMIVSFFFRYFFILVFFLSVLAGIGLVSIVKNIPGWKSMPIALILIVVSLFMPNTIDVLKIRSGGDTRTLARKWIYENVPPDSTVFVGFAAPLLQYDKPSIQKWKNRYANILTKNRDAAFEVEFLREARLHEDKYFYKRFLYLDEVKELPKPGYNVVYIIYSPHDHALIDELNEYWLVVAPDYFFNQNDPKYLGGMLSADVEKYGKVVARFAPEGKMMGDVIEIYRVNHPVAGESQPEKTVPAGGLAPVGGVGK